MSSSSLLRRGLLAVILAAPLALSACTGLRPVYGETGVIRERLALSYARPGNRLEQIVIQDLILRLGNSTAPDVPEIRIAAGAGTRDLTRTSTVKPQAQREAVVTVSFTILDGGLVIAQGTRKASAGYATSGQVIADEAAYKDATERAAHAASESIRLSILGALATGREADTGQ